MFYFLSKTATYLLTPAGWLVAALVWALLTKNTIRRRRLIGIGLGIFWVFGNPFLTNELALTWEWPPASTDPAGAVAVVLTGGMVNVRKEIPLAGEANRYLLGREADRAGQALYLYKVGAVQKILISGGDGDLPFGSKNVSDEGQMTARFLRTAGVRPDDIILENKARNTHENALFSAQLLRQRFGTNQCVLVTSAAHMRRAMACFKKEGVSVVPFPGGFLSSRRSFAPGEWLLPHEQPLADSYYLIREMVGYVVYWVVGYC